MKKIFILSFSVLFSCFILNSCDPWEDDSYHEGGVNTPTMLLKEIKTTSEIGVEGLTTYTYDSNSRLSEANSYSDITNMQTYTKVTYQYVSGTQTIVEGKYYQDGTITGTMTTTINVDGNTANVEIENSMTGNITTQMTFSEPCGVDEAIMTLEFMGDEIENVNTYEYFDSNCSYRQLVDGNLDVTVYKDDKNFPLIDPQANIMGISTHNDIKIENVNGIVETITYTYNELDYPIQAVHTFSEGSGQVGYTEEFIYY